MDVLDPRMAVIGVGAALVGSEKVRRTVGRGVGYVAAGAAKVGAPIVAPVVNAGRDMVGEAREVAVGNGQAPAGRPRPSRTRARARA
jgi:hypothetical protein